MGFVYKITNKITGDFYVGCTSKSIEERFRRHFKVAKSKIDYNSRLYRSIKKYGENTFQIEPLMECDNYLEMEIKFIENLRPTLNLKLGGNGYDLTNQEQFTRSVSAGLKEYWNSLSQEEREKRVKKTAQGSKKYWSKIDRKKQNSPRWGTRHSEEAKEKMRMAKLGKKRKITKKVLEGYKKISKTLTGRKRSFVGVNVDG